jgi:hypothetical protein
MMKTIKALLFFLNTELILLMFSPYPKPFENVGTALVAVRLSADRQENADRDKPCPYTVI